jgi:bifunctional DNA-binding transcriptional regulator/antitoxin component of YhaV-PrlF toxin-antitoxin module
MNAELEIVDIDETGRIVIPQRLCEKIGIHPHDKLILGIKNNTLLITTQVSHSKIETNSKQPCASRI